MDTCLSFSKPKSCIIVLGGSFDPIHNGHINLVKHFFTLLNPDECRIIPTGNPWQKNRLEATPKQRVEMIENAFGEEKIPLIIDQQEIIRKKPTYTKDTLRTLRSEFGPELSIVFLMGADQLQQLNTWKEWKKIFDYAHLGIASRPRYTLDLLNIPTEIMKESLGRSATLDQMRQSAHGLIYLAKNLDTDISATEIRGALHNEQKLKFFLPNSVSEYIKRHHLYKN